MKFNPGEYFAIAGRNAVLVLSRGLEAAGEVEWDGLGGGVSDVVYTVSPVY